MTRPGCTVIKCCLCIPLRNGVLTIGYIELVGKLLMALMTIHFIITVKRHEYLKYDVRSDDEYDAELSEAEQYMEKHKTDVISLLAIWIISALVALLAIIGGHMRKPELLRMYFWIALVLGIAGFIASFLLYLAGRIYISFIIEIILSVCFLVVIRSAYLEMEEELRQEKISNCQPPSCTQSLIP